MAYLSVEQDKQIIIVKLKIETIIKYYFFNTFGIKIIVVILTIMTKGLEEDYYAT